MLHQEPTLSPRWSKIEIVWITLGWLFAVSGGAASAAPLDLADPTPRWVEVRFEVSPEDEPGRLDGTWSAPRTAYLESGPEAGTVRIRIPASEVEAHFRATGTEAVRGSFSEFIWTLDPVSGHVLEAQLEGSIRESFRMGPIRTAATVRIEVTMTTQNAGGFRAGKGVLGIRTYPFCTPGDREEDCIPVAAIRFDPERGYVNAVGMVQAAAAMARIQAFSPLGEVLFSERSQDGTESIVSGTSEQDAICSEDSSRLCGSEQGGES